MPNHITNIVKSSKEVITSMLNEDGFVDFTKIAPRHKDLELNGADGIDFGAESLAEFVCKEPPSDNELIARLSLANKLRTSALDMSKESFEQFVMMVRNKRNHGFYHMMDYSRSAWGTKWNAYNQDSYDKTETLVGFDTAWSCPKPVFVALSKKFPEQEIIIQFADEDTGSNCGEFTLLNGEITQENISPGWGSLDEEGKSKWTKFAFELRNPNEDPRSYGYDENWVYSDEVYEKCEADK